MNYNISIAQSAKIKNRVQFLNATHLKIIAMATMLADHIAIAFADYLSPETVTCLRFIGRLAFPLFAFLIAEGIRYTHNKQNYILRLVVFAVISEVPYDLFLSDITFDPARQNVGWTLLLGAICLVIQQHGNIMIGLSLLVCGSLPLLLRSDYSIFGVLMILAFYWLKKPLWRGIGFASANGLFAMVKATPQTAVMQAGIIPLVLLTLNAYNGEKGKEYGKFSRLWYFFYPLHLLGLWTLRQIL